jgi:5-methylcytosine-specific restriction endonuclease McrA
VARSLARHLRTASRACCTFASRPDEVAAPCDVGEACRETEIARRSAAQRIATHREHIPNATQREILARDGLRCTFVSEDGCRCTASSFLQIHHEQPWAKGGNSTVGNLRLLCAAHNRLLAEQDFGRELIAARRDQRKAATRTE